MSNPRLHPTTGAAEIEVRGQANQPEVAPQINEAKPFTALGNLFWRFVNQTLAGQIMSGSIFGNRSVLYCIESISPPGP
jgi:hypothetical protein